MRTVRVTDQEEQYKIDSHLTLVEF